MVVLSFLVFGLALATFADAQITSRTASQYGMFAASKITNTGLIVIGDMTVLSPGTSITGFPPGTASGQDINNTAAITAKGDIAAAYGDLASLAPTAGLTGENLGGLTLTSAIDQMTAALEAVMSGDPNWEYEESIGIAPEHQESESRSGIRLSQSCRRRSNLQRLLAGWIISYPRHWYGFQVLLSLRRPEFK